jgi:hypothetical protein
VNNFSRYALDKQHMRRPVKSNSVRRNIGIFRDNGDTRDERRAAVSPVTDAPRHHTVRHYFHWKPAHIPGTVGFEDPHDDARQLLYPGLTRQQTTTDPTQWSLSRPVSTQQRLKSFGSPFCSFETRRYMNMR